MARHILITGCSGGGKSTLLRELQAAGYPVVAEPGRRIVTQELARGGNALPWIDLAAFARRAIAMAKSDLEAASSQTGPVFFDRGLVDAAVALQHADGVPLAKTLGGIRHYDDPVFLAPPWPELFANDSERRHGFDEARAEYERLEKAFADLGYAVRPLPKASVGDRLDFVLGQL